MSPCDALDLHRLADELGVQLVRHDGGPPGFYRHSARIISTRRGQSVESYRSTLAHELGHAYYGDVPTGHGYYDARQERRADDYAARLLISPTEFLLAAKWHDGFLPAIADELEVTQHLLEVYLRATERGSLATDIEKPAPAARTGTG